MEMTMADTKSDADGPDNLDGDNAEHSHFGAGETGGGKPADGIAGNLAVLREDAEVADAGVPPEEDPKMAV